MLKCRALSVLPSDFYSSIGKDFLLPEWLPAQVARDGIALRVEVWEGLPCVTHGTWLTALVGKTGLCGPWTLIPASFSQLSGRPGGFFSLHFHTLNFSSLSSPSTHLSEPLRAHSSPSWVLPDPGQNYCPISCSTRCPEVKTYESLRDSRWLVKKSVCLHSLRNGKAQR